MLEKFNPNANVPMDVCTRWNSTYMMLEAALKFSKVFNHMADEDVHYSNYSK